MRTEKTELNTKPSLLTGEHLIENVKASFFPFQIGDPGVIDEAGVDLGFVNNSVLDLNLVEKPGARTLRITGSLGRRQGSHNLQGRRDVLVSLSLQTATFGR